MCAATEERREQWRAAGSNLLKHLISLNAMGKLSAQDTCIACFYAHEGGMLGADFSKYMGKPGLGSGRYQKILDRHLPGPGPVFFESVPTVTHTGSARSSTPIPFAALWENVCTDVEDNPGILTKVQGTKWPPIYDSHSVVRDARKKRQPRPLPLAVFLDGVRVTSQVAGRPESILGLWLINLVNQKRYYFGSLRSGNTCRCGCRGWCSTRPCLNAFAWALNQLADGKRYDTLPNGEKMDDTDDLSAIRIRKGTELGFRCAVIWLKGDLAELPHTLGFPSVSSMDHMCPWCNACSRTVHEHYDGLRMHDRPFGVKTHDDYLRACSRCSRILYVETSEQHKEILQRGNLVPLEGRGFWGLTFQDSVPGAVPPILKGDRLEPCDAMPDPHEFFKKTPPFQTLVWRANMDGQRLLDPIAHSCPLFDEVNGITIENMTVDTLHTMYFGPVQRVSSAIAWRILLANPWGVRGSRLDQRLEAGAARLKLDLFRWQEDRQIPSGERLRDWTLSMMGERKESQHTVELAHPGCHMKLKGAESGLVLLWVSDLLERVGRNVPFAEELRLTVACLVQYLDIIRSCPMVPLPADSERLFGLMVQVNSVSKRAGVAMVPKNHFFYELTRRTRGFQKTISSFSTSISISPRPFPSLSPIPPPPLLLPLRSTHPPPPQSPPLPTDAAPAAQGGKPGGLRAPNVGDSIPAPSSAALLAPGSQNLATPFTTAAGGMRASTSSSG